MLVWVHRGLLAGAALALALAALYAGIALRSRPQRARRAFRAALAGFAFLLADGLGRMPVVLAFAEQTGDTRVIAWSALNLTVRNGVPVLLWGTALFARSRGWLADKVFALAVLIAAGITLLCYLVPV